MTSLQRAAAQCKKLETTKKGAFESSFASGLDFSECDSTTASTSTRTSAAAELLEIKAREAQQAAREEQKDVRLLNLAKARGQERLTANSTVFQVPTHAAPSHESHSSATSVMEHANMSATLFHLHHEDVNGAHHKAKLGKHKSMKAKSTMRRNRPSNKQSKSSSGGTKMGAMKKQRRSKY